MTPTHRGSGSFRAAWTQRCSIRNWRPPAGLSSGATGPGAGGCPTAPRPHLLPGRLTSWKGQTVLIEALARLSGRNVCCVLVGSDQGRRRYSAGLIRQAEALGVADRVRLVGECQDMPAALLLADVVVRHAPTQPEAFGPVWRSRHRRMRWLAVASLSGRADRDGGAGCVAPVGSRRPATPCSRRRHREHGAGLAAQGKPTGSRLPGACRCAARLHCGCHAGGDIGRLPGAHGTCVTDASTP